VHIPSKAASSSASWWADDILFLLTDAIVVVILVYSFVERPMFFLRAPTRDRGVYGSMMSRSRETVESKRVL
jgi:hypothetical protein